MSDRKFLATTGGRWATLAPQRPPRTFLATLLGGADLNDPTMDQDLRILLVKGRKPRSPGGVCNKGEQGVSKREAMSSGPPEHSGAEFDVQRALIQKGSHIQNQGKKG